MAPQIAYNDVCQIVGDLFITRWLENKNSKEDLQLTIQDFQRQVGELKKDREELIAKMQETDAVEDTV